MTKKELINEFLRIAPAVAGLPDDLKKTAEQKVLNSKAACAFRFIDSEGLELLLQIRSYLQSSEDTRAQELFLKFEKYLEDYANGNRETAAD